MCRCRRLTRAFVQALDVCMLLIWRRQEVPEGLDHMRGITVALQQVLHHHQRLYKQKPHAQISYCVGLEIFTATVTLWTCLGQSALRICLPKNVSDVLAACSHVSAGAYTCFGPILSAPRMW